MANKYEILAFAPILIFAIFMIVAIEYQMFMFSALGASISNLVLAWILFFLYKANKYDVKVSGDEQ